VLHQLSFAHDGWGYLQSRGQPRSAWTGLRCGGIS